MPKLTDFTKADFQAFMGVEREENCLPRIYYFTDEECERFFHLCGMAFNADQGDNTWIIQDGRGMTLGYSCGGEDASEIVWNGERGEHAVRLIELLTTDTLPLWAMTVVHADKF